MGKLRVFDYAIIGFILLLAIIPDPSDLLDGGFPLLEPLMAFAYFFVRTRMGNNGGKK